MYDIAFSRAGGGRDMFASVGADGSVRMFDLRHLEHSTIIYEDPQHHPLLRLCWNKQDPNYLATMAMDGMEVSVLCVVSEHTSSLIINFSLCPCLLFLYKMLTYSMSGGDPGCTCAMHARCPAQQPSCLCQRHCLGTPLLLSYMYCR